MKRKCICILAGLALLISLFIPVPAFAAKPTYTVSPTSKTYKKKLMNYSTYNRYTKHYYLLRTYLEQLEKSGGGTLVLKKGTYTISNTLFVPSNVTIKLLNGATIVKGNKTGTSRFKASSSIFQLIRPSKAMKKGVYGSYKGERNISFIGQGRAIMDLKYAPDNIAIIAGHNKNIRIEGIRFQNMKSGHFIEMDATDTAKIRTNQFTGSKPSTKQNKEAINLDTPDRATRGWSQKWSKFDRTPNKKVTIENNSFYNLDRAIGTHKYSEAKYHDQIIIRNNKIDKMRQDAIRVMNWSNTIIENNLIKNIEAGPNHDRRAILASGTINPMFLNNMIENTPRPIQFIPWKNSGPGEGYKVIYNKLSQANKSALKTNTITRYKERFVRINRSYNKFDQATTEKINIRIK